MIRFLYWNLAVCLVMLCACRTASFKSVERGIDNGNPDKREPMARTSDPIGTPSVEPGAPFSPEPSTTPTPPPEPGSGPVAEAFETLRETFIQVGESGKVDILIVIDNSDTMKEEQENLSNKLSDLLQSLRDTDWQIGVITTSVRVANGFDACDLTLIRKSDSDVGERFRRAVSAGTSGSSTEEGIRQAVNGLRCGNWLRPFSTLAVLIVSDEDNCSRNGVECFKQPSNSEQYLIRFVEGDLKRTVGADAGFYGIFSPPASPCSTAENVGVQYQRLVDYKAGGSQNYGNICDASYKKTLEQISGKIARLLTAQFDLQQAPEAGSLQVSGKKSKGDAIDAGDFTLRGRTLIFKRGEEPALGSEFQATYRVKK